MTKRTLLFLRASHPGVPVSSALFSNLCLGAQYRPPLRRLASLWWLSIKTRQLLPSTLLDFFLASYLSFSFTHSFFLSFLLPLLPLSYPFVFRYSFPSFLSFLIFIYPGTFGFRLLPELGVGYTTVACFFSFLFSVSLLFLPFQNHLPCFSTFLNSNIIFVTPCTSPYEEWFRVISVTPGCMS